MGQGGAKKMLGSHDACRLCPRSCGVKRSTKKRGRCKAPQKLVIARAALHFWEEPPLSGMRGSGAIFFAYCSLGCLYCQNAYIAQGRAGQEVTSDRLTQICLELQAQGALNINLVTPTHFAPAIRQCIIQARREGLQLPIVWNTSGYEVVQEIRNNEGIVDVYVSDFKYAGEDVARRYSDAPDYPKVAMAALEAMVDAVGPPVFDEVDGQPRILKGVMVRHLMLPGALEDSLAVVGTLYEHFGNAILFSLMSQYTPVVEKRAQAGDVRAASIVARYPELAKRVTSCDYEKLLTYADSQGIQDYFWQVGDAAQESFIPEFDLRGVARSC